MSNILINLAAAYIFILLIKVYFFLVLRNSLGNYKHSDSNDTVVFNVSFVYKDFLSPIPRVTLAIKRLDQAKNNSLENWSGTYFSDMLNPNVFTGAYKKFGNANIPEKGDMGWHELIFFYKEELIALRINHVGFNENTRKKVWNSSEGYFIKKING